jgi:type IV pilus assembly protein PilQ
MTSIRLWTMAVALAVGAALAAPRAEQAPATVASGLEQFSGTPIDVNYEGANLRTVLRTLVEIGGVNLVIDPSVPNTATVDLRLTQVPWNQVMEVVLRSQQLTAQLEGNVLRVMTREAQTKELTDVATQKRASEQAPDLQLLKMRLNYASAAEISELLETAQFVSERGSVEFEERTNMVIVKDTPRVIEEIQALVLELDRPEPQVEIEARIVQARNDAARALGVQWGLNGRVSPDLGNTTNLAFPNRGSIGGRTVENGPVTQGPALGSDPRASGLEETGTAVNLPVTGATSALGLALGSVNGAFNLDVQLSALESQGALEIVSRPKITTQNNKQAEITQGFRIPIQVVSNNTITVQFEDAALKLSVLPQITAANTVIMQILLENAFPDFSNDVNGNPSINTQRAETHVQVSDGMTTVIGGIMQTRESSSTDRTPGLGRLPLLGWLFKRETSSSESQELLVFLTPRIIRG